MNKILSLSGNVASMLSLLAFLGYMGLNTAFDLGSISQSADAEMFKDYRDMLLIPGLAFGLLGLGLSGAYVAKNKDEMSSLEIAAPIVIPVLSLIGLALFAFVL